MNDRALSLWARARDSLAAARAVVQVDPDSAASRAYYAAFYAVSALLAVEERSFRRHQGLQAAVHRDLVKAGRWTTELGEDFDGLVVQRKTGDYGDVLRVNRGDLPEILSAAQRILSAVHGEFPGDFELP